MKKAVFLIIIIISFYSCNNKDKGIPNYPIHADLKAAFNYQPGTYWIYRDSISGRVDSFAVRSNMFSPGSANNASGVNSTFDGIEIYITEYNAGSFIDTTAWQINLFYNCVEIIWYKDFLSRDLYFDFDPAFNYPFKTGIPSIIGGQQGDYSAYVTNILSNYVLSGNSYTNIAEINYYYSNGNYLFDNWFYVNSDAGLVKMRIYYPYYSINKVWELQKWNIVK